MFSSVVNSKLLYLFIYVIISFPPTKNNIKAIKKDSIFDNIKHCCLLYPFSNGEFRIIIQNLIRFIYSIEIYYKALLTPLKRFSFHNLVYFLVYLKK